MRSAGAILTGPLAAVAVAATGWKAVSMPPSAAPAPIFLFSEGNGTSPDPALVRSAPDRIRLEHVVRPGENIWTIARAYGTDVDTLRGLNRLDYPLVQPGQKILVVNRPLPEVSRAFGFSAPVRGRLTSRFGMRRHPILGGRRFHSGIDIAWWPRAPVVAARDGRVVFAGSRSGYGRLVEIRHADGYLTRYAHLSRIHVREGQMVRRGRIVGRIGSSGLSTGPHLHFEVLRRGRPVNPARLLWTLSGRSS